MFLFPTHYIKKLLYSFFHYKLVGKFQTEAALKNEEADNYKMKVTSLRKLVVQLLRRTNKVSG